MRLISYSGVENCLFLCVRGGKQTSKKEKIANPRGCALGGGGVGCFMVTSKIEPCITLLYNFPAVGRPVLLL